MYTNFDLGIEGRKITGYHWAIENPKKVVVLIHGIGEHAGRYNRMAGYFAKAGIALVRRCGFVPSHILHRRNL